MSVEHRAYDNEHGDPVVVLVATGTHDVSRLVNLLDGASPNCEQRRLYSQIVAAVRRAQRWPRGAEAAGRSRWPGPVGAVPMSHSLPAQNREPENAAGQDRPLISGDGSEVQVEPQRRRCPSCDDTGWIDENRRCHGCGIWGER